MLAATLTLTGCESSEERAQRHYESALELLEEGDAKRAFVEFRNVFKLNPRHKEARMAYANAQMERGNISEAYGQFLRVVEQYPETIEARFNLAEMAILGRNWEEARRHGEAVIDLAPDSPRSDVIETALAYSEAARNEDTAGREELGERAEAEQRHPPLLAGRHLLLLARRDTARPTRPRRSCCSLCPATHL